MRLFATGLGGRRAKRRGVSPPERGMPNAVSVVIPCYDEQGSIAGTVRAVDTALASVGAYEIIVANSGSTDGSLEIRGGVFRAPSLRLAAFLPY